MEEEESRIDWDEEDGVDDDGEDEDEDFEIAALSKGGRQTLDQDEEEAGDDEENEGRREHGAPSDSDALSRVKEATTDSHLMPTLAASPYQRPRSPVPPSYVETPPILKHTRIDWPRRERGMPNEGSSLGSPAEVPELELGGEELQMESENEPVEEAITMEERIPVEDEEGPRSPPPSPQEEGRQSGTEGEFLLGDSRTKMEYPLNILEDEDNSLLQKGKYI
jgi:hypothetical protein